MLAKIVKIQSNDATVPQIDVHVEYEDPRFPATHQHPDGGKRLQIFTCPPEKIERLHLTVLEEMILSGGEQLDLNFPVEDAPMKKALTTKDLQDRATELQVLIGTELGI